MKYKFIEFRERSERHNTNYRDQKVISFKEKEDFLEHINKTRILLSCLVFVLGGVVLRRNHQTTAFAGSPEIA